MKKILNSIMLLLLAGTSALMVSCKDDDNNAAPGTDREFMTMFICDNTRGKGTDYPYNSGLDGAYPHGNTIHLYWYGVNDCAGYQIQMGLQIKVSGGAEAWKKVQGTSDLLLDTIVGPKQLDLLLKDLQYSTNYRFAIRALSKLDKNILGDESTFAHASNWYGHGNGRQWQEYLGITTNDRYPTPMAIYVNQAETTEKDMHVYFNTNISQLGLNLSDEDDKDKYDAYHENFNIDADGNFGYKYLTVQPSPNNPNSTVDEKWKKYEITDEDRARGYVVVTGLTPNSVYVIDVIDPRVPVAIDSKYNTCTARSDGQPGAPILQTCSDRWPRSTTLPLSRRRSTTSSRTPTTLRDRPSCWKVERPTISTATTSPVKVSCCVPTPRTLLKESVPRLYAVSAIVLPSLPRAPRVVSGMAAPTPCSPSAVRPKLVKAVKST